MRNFFYGAAAAVVIVVGLTVVLKSMQTPEPLPASEQVLGGAYDANGYNPQYFYQGVYTYGGPSGGKYDKDFDSSSTPTTTLSSLAVAGHLTIATGQTSENVSTTAITALNDRVVVQLEQTSPIAGVTCNTTLNASSSEATKVFASSTAPTQNGFSISVANSPVTNPFCYSYSISHGF